MTALTDISSLEAQSLALTLYLPSTEHLTIPHAAVLLWFLDYWAMVYYYHHIFLPFPDLQASLGTNPISFAAPASEGDSFVLDMATSTAALGKVSVRESTLS